MDTRMAANRDKGVESVQVTTVAASCELCRYLCLSQPCLLRFSPPQRPGKHPDGFKLVRTIDMLPTEVSCKQQCTLCMALYSLDKVSTQAF